MAKINLLPWREERRAELKRQFYTVLAGVAILGAAAVYAVDYKVNNEIAGQKSRNEFVKTETKKMDKKIAEIRELKKKREELLSRMEVIQDLQGNRSIIVHVFDEIARTVPEGVYLTKVNKSGKTFNIEGRAEANNRISNYMRNLDASEWFANPNLTEVKAADDAEESTFKLTVQESSPKTENSEEENG